MVDVPSKGYQPIENYGIIGDLYTVALGGCLRINACRTWLPGRAYGLCV